MIQIIPAILSTAEADYERDISRYKEILLLRNKQALFFKDGWVHIDFMDNIFVLNKSIGPSVVAKYPINLQKEAHLMVARPLEWIDDSVTAGFKRIIIHIEAEGVQECIEYVKSKGLEVGLAINNETPIEKIEPFADKLDVIVAMGVMPGFQGQGFIPQTINRVKQTVQLRSQGKYSFKIGVDGAVKDDNIRSIVDAGVDFVIVGSYLLKGDIDENLENLWEAIK